MKKIYFPLIFLTALMLIIPTSDSFAFWAGSVKANVNPDFPVEDWIEQLTEARREDRIVPLENELIEYDRKTEGWKGLEARLRELNRIVREYYRMPINNSFDKMKADSGDPDSYDVSADKNASIKDHKIQVNQIAKGDSLSSDPVPYDKELKAGKICLDVGEHHIEVDFKGGNIVDLAKAINKAGGDIIQASTINYDGVNHYLIVESLVTGKQNYIKFSCDLDVLAEIGLITSNQEIADASEGIVIPFTEMLPSPEGNGYHIEGGNLIISPRRRVYLEFPDNISLSASSVIHIELMKEKPKKDDASIAEIENELGVLNKIEIEENEVWDVPLIVDPWADEFENEKDKGPSKYAFAKSVSTQIKSFDLNLITDKWKTYDILVSADIENYNEANGLVFSNLWLDNRLVIKSIKISDPDAGKRQGKNYESEAQDAEVDIDGVPITRPDNTIKDALPGVELTLKKVSDKPSTMEIDRDYDSMSEDMDTFVAYYNIVMTYIFNSTHRFESKREEAKYLKKLEDMDRDDEGEILGEYVMGFLASERTVFNIKLKLDQIIAAPYEVAEAETMILMHSSQAFRDKGHGFNRFSLNTDEGKAGLIDFDKRQFKRSLKENYEKIRNLFALDKDSDFLWDSGLFVTLDNFTYDTAISMGDPVSLIASNLNYVKQRKRYTAKELEREEKKLEDYEDKLRREFSYMLQQIEELKAKQKDIGRLNSNNNN